MDGASSQIFITKLSSCNGKDITNDIAGSWLANSGVTRLDIGNINTTSAYLYFRQTWAGSVNVYTVWLEK